MIETFTWRTFNTEMTLYNDAVVVAAPRFGQITKHGVFSYRKIISIK